MAKKSVSMKIDEQYIKALDVLVEQVPKHLPATNRSLFMSHLLKSFIYQVVNNRESMIEDKFKAKQGLSKLGITSRSLVMLDNVDLLKFCEERQIIEEQKKLRDDLKQELSDLNEDFNKLINAKSKLEAQIKSLEETKNSYGNTNDIKKTIKNDTNDNQQTLDKVEVIENVQVIDRLDESVLLLLINSSHVKDYCNRYGIEYEDKGYLVGTDVELEAILGIAKENDVKLSMKLRRMKEKMFDEAFVTEDGTTFTNYYGVKDVAKVMKEQFELKKAELEQKKIENQRKQEEMKRNMMNKKDSRQQRKKAPSRAVGNSTYPIHNFTVELNVIFDDEQYNYTDEEEFEVIVNSESDVNFKLTDLIQERIAEITEVPRGMVEYSFPDRELIQYIKGQFNAGVTTLELNFDTRSED